MRKFAFSLLLGVSAAALSGCYIFQPRPPANAQLIGKAQPATPAAQRTTARSPQMSNNDRSGRDSSRGGSSGSNTGNDNTNGNSDNDSNGNDGSPSGPNDGAGPWG